MKNLVILIIIAALALPCSGALAKSSGRNFALEILYGASNATILPLNPSGKALYGNSIFANPVGLRLTWAAASLLNIGMSYSSTRWIEDKNLIVDANIYSNPRLNLTTFSPFVDLTPLALGRRKTRGVTEGLFVEAGPCWTTVEEEYEVGGHPYSFSSTAMSLDIRVGLRTFNRDVLSFVADITGSIPIYSDGKRSESGLTLNGASSISLNAGICASF
jgi:hypothetical protein